MKHFLRRFWGLLCAITIIAGMATQSVALSIGDLYAKGYNTHSGEKQRFSEYDYIVAIRGMCVDDLKALNLPLAEKNKILSNEIENEILARKQLTNRVLVREYGYNALEIAILRRYTGGRLEDHPELRAITGTLTFDTPIVMTSTTKKVKIKVYWDWNHKPFVCNTDAIAVAWSPTFRNGKYGNMMYVSSESNHILWYKGSSVVGDSATVPIKNTVPNGAVKSEFKLYGDHLGIDREPVWACSGTFNLCLKTTADDVSLSQVNFVFVYAHSTFRLTPSISFDSGGAGIGISCGWGTDDADNLSGYVKANNTTWYQS